MISRVPEKVRRRESRDAREGKERSSLFSWREGMPSREGEAPSDKRKRLWIGPRCNKTGGSRMFECKNMRKNQDVEGPRTLVREFVQKVIQGRGRKRSFVPGILSL